MTSDQTTEPGSSTTSQPVCDAGLPDAEHGPGGVDEDAPCVPKSRIGIGGTTCFAAGLGDRVGGRREVVGGEVHAPGGRRGGILAHGLAEPDDAAPVDERLRVGADLGTADLELPAEQRTVEGAGGGEVRHRDVGPRRGAGGPGLAVGRHALTQHPCRGGRTRATSQNASCGGDITRCLC